MTLTDRGQGRNWKEVSCLIYCCQFAIDLQYVALKSHILFFPPKALDEVGGTLNNHIKIRTERQLCIYSNCLLHLQAFLSFRLYRDFSGSWSKGNKSRTQNIWRYQIVNSVQFYYMLIFTTFLFPHRDFSGSWSRSGPSCCCWWGPGSSMFPEAGDQRWGHDGPLV